MACSTLHLLMVVAAAAGEPSVADLQAALKETKLQLNEHLTLTLKQKLQIEEQKAQLDEHKAQLDEQKTQIEELRELVRGGRGAAAPSTTVKFGVEGTGAGRALSEASSSMAVHAWQTHQFPESPSGLERQTNEQQISRARVPPFWAAATAAPTWTPTGPRCCSP